MVTDFSANRRKLTCQPSFSTLVYHNEWEDRNVDARVNSADDLSTSFKNLVTLVR